MSALPDTPAQSDQHAASHLEDEGHGGTPAAWTTVTIVFIGFALGAVGVLASSWVFFGIGVGAVVVGPVIGKVMSVIARPAANRPAGQS